MPVLYAGERIIPAPFVSISKSFFRSGDDEKLGAGFNITLRGTLLPGKGTPYTDGSSFTTATGYPADQTVTRNASGIMSKMAAIRDLFAEDGKLLHIYACDLSDEEIACYPFVQGDVTFNDGTWVNDADYEVTLFAPLVSGTLNGTKFSVFPSGEDAHLTPYIKSAEESWNIEVAEPENDVKLKQHSFRVTHNLSAVGQRVYFPSGSNHLHGIITKQPWEWAKHWCESKLIANPVPTVFSSGMASGILNAPSGYLTAYNHLRSVTPDIRGGSYAVNDTWILSSGSAFEDFTVTVQTSIEDGLTNVSVEGSIQGMEVIDYLDPLARVSSSKWETASGLWTTTAPTLYSRSNAFYTGTLHVTPTSTVVGYNPVNGVINYTYAYNDRPANCINSPLVISEVIDVSDNFSTDVFSSLGVPGRASGPILQDIDTVTSPSRLLNIEVVLRPSGCATSPPTNVLQGVNAFIATVSGELSTYGQIFKSQDDQTYSLKSGRFRRTVGWTMGICG